jgi:hypothetical protein
MRAHCPIPGDVTDGKGQHMKKVGMRRGVRAFVLVGAVVGLVTVGFAGQAFAPPPPARTVAGFSQSVNPNNSITTGIRAVAVGETVVVFVATGTHTATPLPDVGCRDSSNNTYIVRADKNTGNGRLFVCVANIVHALPGGTSTVTATYPGFSGTSVIDAIAVPFPLFDFASTGSGSNPPVSTGNVFATETNNLLVGVVANGNVSSFTPDPGWTQVTPPAIPYSGGSGAGKRTLTPVYQLVGPGSYALTGHLTGPGFWQAAVISLSV